MDSKRIRGPYKTRHGKLSRYTVLLFLTGCAVFDAPQEEFHWYRERPPATKPYARMYAAPEDVGPICRTLGGDGTERACTRHSLELIVLPIGAPAWYLEHELRHQNGENHP